MVLVAVALLLAGTLDAQEPLDSKFQELRGARATISFSLGDSLRAVRFLELLEAQPRLPALPDSLPSGVQVFLASTQAAFDSVIGGSVPEWTGGVAIPARSMLVDRRFCASRPPVRTATPTSSATPPSTIAFTYIAIMFEAFAASCMNSVDHEYFRVERGANWTIFSVSWLSPAHASRLGAQ